MWMRIAALGVAMALPCAASAADLSGAWVVKAEVGPQFKYTLMCVLKPNAPALEGTCIGVQGRTLRTVGRRSGANLRFGYDTDYNGNGIHLDYNGTVAPNGVAKGGIGTVGNGRTTGVFEASPMPEFSTDRVTGWRVNVGFGERMKYVVLCAFNADGERLGGPCAIVQGVTLPVTGAADGTAVNFAYDTTFQGQPLHVDYAGSVQPDGTVKGKITAGQSVGTFSASRP